MRTTEKKEKDPHFGFSAVDAFGPLCDIKGSMADESRARVVGWPGGLPSGLEDEIITRKPKSCFACVLKNRDTS